MNAWRSPKMKPLTKPPRAWSRKNVWEALPAPARHVVGLVLGGVPTARLLGRGFRRQRRFVDRAQWWSGDQAADYALQHARRIITLAMEQTRYYADTYRAVGFEPGDLKSLADLRGLPTIDKDTVRDHLGDMLTRSPERGGVDLVSTGGTGGAPLSFYMDAGRTAVEYAYLTASFARIGYQVGGVMAVLRGRTIPRCTRGMHYEYDPLLHHHYYSAFHLSEEAMDRYLRHMDTLGPFHLHVYPSAVLTLARHLRRKDRRPPPGMRGIVAESERVTEDERRFVQDVFGCRCFSAYGQSEKVVAASECEHSTDYHVWPTYGHAELIGTDGQPVVTPGTRGEIVGTGFLNSVVPFIRYRTGDEAEYVAAGCRGCRRAHMLLRDIGGRRVTEFLVAADGTRISWTALNMHDDTFLRVRQLQFCQDTPGRAILRIVPGSGYSAEDDRIIVERVERRLQGQLTVAIEHTEEIRLTERGKAIYVDQRVPLSHVL